MVSQLHARSATWQPRTTVYKHRQCRKCQRTCLQHQLTPASKGFYCYHCLVCLYRRCWHYSLVCPHKSAAGAILLCACTGSASSTKPNLTDRFAGNLRKAIGITAKEADGSSQAETEAAQAAAQSAEALVQVALAAFAISAYIRSTLCPSLQSYEPQPKLPQTWVRLSVMLMSMVVVIG